MSRIITRVEYDKIDLSTNLCGFRLANPIILASGFLGSSGDMLKKVAAEGAGALVTKTIGMEERQGYQNPFVEDKSVGLAKTVVMAFTLFLT